MTALAIVLGTLAAMAVQRFAFFGRESISLLIVLPIALPGIVTGIAMNAGFRPGDIVISTPPKCGTTWTQMLCALLIFDAGTGLRALGQKLAAEAPWNAAPYALFVEQLQEACDITTLGFEDSVRDWDRVLEFGERWIEGTFFRRARAMGNDIGYDSIVGMTAEVTVTNGAVKVDRVVIVCDCGVVVNPRIAAQQMESAVIFGLGAALIMGFIGIMAGLWAEKFDHMAAVTNFVIDRKSVV